jgi:D-beta-D-heptose 7-phosphate kinase/D-beta-D-heptose 1-phosphate adenosyltransferase
MSKKNELKILENFNRARVAVLGDMMLDVYIWGQVNRISPEAPVPVVSVTKRTCCLGGAANVMRNIATLGARAEGFGVIGKDEAGTQVIAELQEAGIAPGGVITSLERPTTEKRRIMASGQQLLRIDEENTSPVPDEIRRKLVSGIIDRIRSGNLDAVIFEDYAKGLLASWMLEEIIIEARKYKVTTALDPKPGGLDPVKGLTFIKPNRLEAFAMAKIQDKNPGAFPGSDPVLNDAASRLLDMWEPDHLLISLASQGMALFSRNKATEVIPTRAREVFDVSGAGDTVTASYTLSLVGGADPVTAAEIANRAASVVVAKVGTAPIYYNELVKVCEQEDV